MTRLGKFDWRIAEAPWSAIYNAEAAKIVSAKENAELLADLLYVHLAPQSREQVKRARRSYRSVRGKQYPVSEAELEKEIKS